MWFLIRGAFWFTMVLVALPFFDGEAQQKLQGAPQVEATEALSAAAGAISYMSQMCAERPDVCVKGAETVSALGTRAKEGALVAYKMLDKKFSTKDKPDAEQTAEATLPTGSLPATASQPLPDKLTTGTIIPVPQARPAH
jgi:hypothetical protein